MDGDLRWWSDRWAWRGAVAAAPLGALAALLFALVELRAAVSVVLLSYALGAAVAAGAGCLLGGPIGAAVEASRRDRRRDGGVDVVLDLVHEQPQRRLIRH
jgi:hypothetical protein